MSRTLTNAIVLTVLYLLVIQILALNADNAASNDTQTTALAEMENSFEEVNRARCFNHTLQLSAKTLLKPFNTGMSSAQLPVEEEGTLSLDDKGLTLLDDNSTDGDDNDDKGISEDDLSDDNESEGKDDDGIDELEVLDKNEREKILADTAVVRQTVSKVRINSVQVPHRLSLTAGSTIIFRNHSLDNHCAPSLANHLYPSGIQAPSHSSRCCHTVELNI